MAIEYARHREATLGNLSFVAAQTAQVIENSLQHEMLSHNLEGIRHMLDGIGEDKKIRAIYMMDTTGRIAFAPRGVEVGRQLDNRDPTCQPCHQLPATMRPSSVVITLPDGQRVFRSMNPLENRPECHECHDPDQRLNGVLLTDIWVAPLEAPLAADLRSLAAQQQELLKRLITAQEEERRRVARDLHDGLGQDLAGLAFGLEAVERLWAAEPDQAHSRLWELRTGIAETTNRLYEMILTLRPSVLDDLGLAPALRVQAEQALKEAGIQFELDADDLKRRLPPEVETALFRTFQEALCNVARHAGASHVRMSLAACDGEFEGEIVDDGRGFDPQTIRPDGHSGRGLGLLGMQERVAQCGGTLEIVSRPGAGARLRIKIPLPEAASD